jgi:tetratricopeptide (TPR) repeat protein
VYEAAGSVDELADMAIADAEARARRRAALRAPAPAARTLLYGTGETTMGPEYAERAIEIVGRARALAPDHIDGVLLNADALGAAGRGGEARELVTQIVAAQRGRRSPELGQAYYALYRVEAREGNLTDALDVLVKSFEVQPQNVPVALELGQLASDLAQTDVAQRAFRSVTLVKPGDGNVTNTQRAVAYCQLGRIAMEQGDARRAKMMLERALGEDPTLAAASELLAQLG